MASDPTPFHYGVPRDVRAQFAEAMGESVDDADAVDTNLACNIYIAIYGNASALARGTVEMDAHLVADTASSATLTISPVSVLSRTGYENLLKVGDSNTVQDVRCVFRHPQTHQPLENGCVEVQFWRKNVAPEQRLVVTHEAPSSWIELAATPKWDDPELNLSGREFDTDRRNIVEVMRCFRNLRPAMPIGITTLLDLVYKTDFYTGKRKRTDDRAPVKRGVGATGNSGALASNHVGYCIIFQHPMALPAFNAAFLAFMQSKIGAPLLDWIVLFPHTKPVTGDPSKVCRRGEALAIVLRRSSALDTDVAPFTVSGASWLAQRVDAGAKTT